MAPREYVISAAIETKYKVVLARMPLCYVGLPSGGRATMKVSLKHI